MPFPKYSYSGLIGLISIFPMCLCGQNRYISLGNNVYGICFGNSPIYSGIRFNLLDKKVYSVNGINVAGLSPFWHIDADSLPGINGLSISPGIIYANKTNGLSLNAIADSTGKSNGISVGGLFTWANTSNGINVAGLAAKSRRSNGINAGFIAALCENANGITASLFFTGVEKKLNGIGLTPGILAVDTASGLTLGGIAVWSPLGDEGAGRITGLTLSAVGVQTSRMTGMVVSAVFNKFDTLRGVSVSLVNSSKQLHGFEFGLLNYAGNNKRLFRFTPFVNFNLKRKRNAGLKP